MRFYLLIPVFEKEFAGVVVRVGFVERESELYPVEFDEHELDGLVSGLLSRCVVVVVAVAVVDVDDSGVVVVVVVVAG